ncbi:hypothetical protein MNBD_GAMMA13-788 [hydrothermal vent metagenome]|uniref:Uncharacterized protein n=1 Tax=hydrothermal vent metagenome TaxID=652676 RepID=A0A3B0YHA3_9ZZZZ
MSEQWVFMLKLGARQMRNKDGKEKIVAARRKFLKDAGKYAAYTPPAVMMLMKPSYAAISNSVVGQPGVGVPPPDDPRRQ